LAELHDIHAKIVSILVLNLFHLLLLLLLVFVHPQNSMLALANNVHFVISAVIDLPLPLS